MVIKNRYVQEEKIKTLIKRYSSIEWLEFLFHIAKNHKHSSVQQSLDNHILKYVIAVLCEKVILYTNPHRLSKSKMDISRDYKHIENILLNLLIDDPHVPTNFNISNTESLHLLVRKAQTQYVVSEKIFTQFHRITFLFDELLSSSEMAEHNLKFDFHYEFQKIFNQSPNDYLLLGFMLFTYSLNGHYNREALLKFIKDIKPDFTDEGLLNFIKIFSSDRNGLIEFRNKFSPKQPEYNYHAMPLLKLHPILHIYNQYNQKSPKGDIMISPLPYLIVNRVHDAIYYQLKDQNKEFTYWFGRLLETYCKVIIQKTFSGICFLSENEIRKTYNTRSGKTPDFVIIADNIAVLIECKAARIYRGLTESNSCQQFEIAFEHEKNAYNQLINFAEAIKNKSCGLEKLHAIEKIYGIIVTWEEYSPIIYDTLKDQIIAQGNPQIPFLMLSVDKLEQLQAALSKSSNPLADLLELFNNKFKTAWTNLTKHTKSRHSFLDTSFHNWTARNLPSEVIIQSQRLIHETAS